MTCPMYDVGDVPRFVATFTDPDGGVCDPATVTVTLLLPDGTTTAIIPTNPSTGSYVIVAPEAADPGEHWLRVHGSGGDCGASDESTRYVVRTSRFPGVTP